MKINSISVNSIKCSPIKPQNFKGVWSRTSKTTDIEPALNIPMVKHFFYYHPFKDETEDQILKVLKDNSDARLVYDDGDKYVVKECKKAVTAPYTRDEYEAYRSLTPNSKLQGKMREIHRDMQEKYATSGFYGSQLPATNPNVSE